METVPSEPEDAKVLYLRRVWQNERYCDATRRGTKKRARHAHWMEGERIDGIDVVYVVDRLSMTFERILFALNFWTGINELDSYPSLHARGCESCKNAPPPHIPTRRSVPSFDAPP